MPPKSKEQNFIHKNLHGRILGVIWL